MGSTPTNTMSHASRTAWLSAAIVTISGNWALSVAAFSAPRGDSTMLVIGNALSVHMPRTMADDIVPTPTKP